MASLKMLIIVEECHRGLDTSRLSFTILIGSNWHYHGNNCRFMRNITSVLSYARQNNHMAACTFIFSFDIVSQKGSSNPGAIDESFF